MTVIVKWFYPNERYGLRVTAYNADFVEILGCEEIEDEWDFPDGKYIQPNFEIHKKDGEVIEDIHGGYVSEILVDGVKIFDSECVGDYE